MAKKKNKKKAKLHSDFGTRERSQHGPVIIEKVAEEHESSRNRDRARALELDDPLYVYRRNRSITPAQRDAGLILRELWNRTGLEPRTISAYQELIASGSVSDLRTKSIDNYQKYLRAVRYVGLVASNEVMAVCCLNEFINPRHMEILRRGLDRLVEHFGIE